MEYSRNEQFMNSNAPWRQPKQVVEGLFVPEKKKIFILSELTNKNSVILAIILDKRKKLFPNKMISLLFIS